MPPSRPSLLLACPAPLDPRLGVAQMALHLAPALERCGWRVDLVSLSPGRSRTLAQLRHAAQEAYAGCRADVFECPALLAAALPRGGALVSCRNVQPDLLYLKSELRVGPARRWVAGGWTAAQYVAGLQRADAVAALGALEAAWLTGRAPWLAGRLHAYVNAPGDADRGTLADVAARRTPLPAHRLLWLGRWVTHKGTGAALGFLERRLSDHPEERATLAGTGRPVPLPDALRGRVDVVESFPRDDLPRLLAAHDVGLFTSEAEGWGLSVSEMLEAGMTVYATWAGGVPDLQPSFPVTLKPFPPPGAGPLAAPFPGLAPGYLARFCWEDIARGYGAFLLQRLEAQRG
ncbi:MAG: glycosyltransferase family 4 protein [Deltaproteobacteria bacterium]|nr:glycosyltransferase family 4 protein [Deltaproteobacteria bacterium]